MQKESSKTAEKPKATQNTLQKPSIISSSTQKTLLNSNNQTKQAIQPTIQSTAKNNLAKPQAISQLSNPQKSQASSNTKQNLTQEKSDIKKTPTNESQSQKIQAIYLNQQLLKSPAAAGSNILKKSDQKITNESNDSQSHKIQANQTNLAPQKKVTESNAIKKDDQKVVAVNSDSGSQKSQIIQAIQTPQKKPIQTNNLQKGEQKIVTENSNSQDQKIQATQAPQSKPLEQNELKKVDQKIATEDSTQNQKSEIKSQKTNLSSSKDEKYQQIGQQDDQSKANLISSKSKFLEIFGDAIINKIMSFFMIEDYVKTATISRYFRKKVPQVLSTLDYTKRFKQMNSSQYLEFNLIGKDIALNSINYNKLIKNSIQEIQKEMSEFQTKKKSAQEEVYLDIFTKSCNFFMKSNQNKQEIIKFILNAGLATVFQQISCNFIQPSKIDLKIPAIQDESQNTLMIQLLKIICQYFNLQQKTSKMDIDNQKSGVRFYKLFQHISKVQKVKSQLIEKYGRPIMYLSKDNNAFNYINKNTIQVILPFLKAQDIIKLCLVSKSMYQLIQNCCQNMLERFLEERKQLLQDNKISDDQAKAVMYLEHYNVFTFYNQGVIPSYYFSEIHLKELIYALWQTVKSKGSSGEIYINSKNPQNIPRYFYAGHNFYNANSEKLSIIEECLKKYTDDFVEKGELQEDYYRQNMILLQKYLKGIKLFIQLNLNEESFPEIQCTYQEKIMKIERQIYQYQNICKQNTEKLEVFTFDFSQPFKEMRMKDTPRRLFE
ncbi:hypothetical protein ABPG74_001539 [Tetrahymena malaccensis]